MNWISALFSLFDKNHRKASAAKFCILVIALVFIYREFDERDKAVRGKISGLNTRIENKLSKQKNEIVSIVDARLGKFDRDMDRRFTELEKDFSSVDSKIMKIFDRINEIKWHLVQKKK